MTSFRPLNPLIARIIGRGIYVRKKVPEESRVYSGTDRYGRRRFAIEIESRREIEEKLNVTKEIQSPPIKASESDLSTYANLAIHRYTLL